LDGNKQGLTLARQVDNSKPLLPRQAQLLEGQIPFFRTSKYNPGVWDGSSRGARVVL